MEKTILFDRNQENIFEFDISIDGIKANGLTVRFVIVISDVEYGFKATQVNDSNGKSNTKWVVKIPALDAFTKDKKFPFYIDVVCNGYIFKPLEGHMHVSDTAEVRVSTLTRKLTTTHCDDNQKTKQSEVIPPLQKNDQTSNDDESTVKCAQGATIATNTQTNDKKSSPAPATKTKSNTPPKKKIFDKTELLQLMKKGNNQSKRKPITRTELARIVKSPKS